MDLCIVRSVREHRSQRIGVVLSTVGHQAAQPSPAHSARPRLSRVLVTCRIRVIYDSASGCNMRNMMVNDAVPGSQRSRGKGKENATVHLHKDRSYCQLIQNNTSFICLPSTQSHSSASMNIGTQLLVKEYVATVTSARLANITEHIFHSLRRIHRHVSPVTTCL